MSGWSQIVTTRCCGPVWDSRFYGWASSGSVSGRGTVGERTKEEMAQFVTRVMNNDVSAYLFGWGVATFDALYSLEALMATKDGKTSAGNYNGGRFSDATLDGMIGQIKVEMDAAKRDALLAQALQRVKDGYYYIPLHHQIRPWAMRKNVETPHRADDRPMPTWTTIK